MNESIIIGDEVKQTFTARATLAALGMKIRQKKMFEPVTEKVKIRQKTVKYTPAEKLLDAEIAILSGAQGMVEINKRVRPDRGLQAAFGREGCAEQSVVQDTLDACTAENVIQMQAALDEIYRKHSRGYRHKYQRNWQLLDADMTGRPCGKKAAFATKGYFAKQRNRRGRQEGYLIATIYEEIVAKQLYDGKIQLSKALRPLVEAAEKTLGLDQDEEKRKRTILRVDSGGGSVDDINWVLKRSYHIHCKDYSGTRAQNLAKSVIQWFDDPHCPERQVGWVTQNAEFYFRPVKRIAVRCRKNNGQWGIGVLISSLSPQDVLALMGQPIVNASEPLAVLLAYVYFYDLRGGGVETEIKEDKQGLGTSKRNKKRFDAQCMVAHLEALAHNILVWARHWLAPLCPKVAQFGMLRLVRDVFHMNGLIVLHQASSHVVKIVLNQADPLAKELYAGFASLFAQEHVAITLGET
jgi:hypothetical protein